MVCRCPATDGRLGEVPHISCDPLTESAVSAPDSCHPAGEGKVHHGALPREFEVQSALTLWAHAEHMLSRQRNSFQTAKEHQ